MRINIKDSLKKAYNKIDFKNNIYLLYYMINNEDLEKKMEECFELFIKYVCNNEVNIDLQRYFNKYAYGDIIDDKPNGRWFIISKKK